MILVTGGRNLGVILYVLALSVCCVAIGHLTDIQVIANKQMTPGPCESLPHSHPVNGSCVCDDAYFMDDLTDECEKCSPCCQDSTRIEECVQKGRAEDSCKAMKGCPPPANFWTSWKAIVVFSILGVIMVFVVIYICRKRVRVCLKNHCCQEHPPEPCTDDPENEKASLK